MPTACEAENQKSSGDACGDEKQKPPPTGDLPPFQRVKSTTPPGFHMLLEKVIRAILLNRPLHIFQFVSDFLIAEVEKKALNDLQSGCLLKKSKIGTAYPSASCTILDQRYAAAHVEEEVTEGVAPDETEPAEPGDNTTDIFCNGPIPVHDPQSPALDRYRECMDIGTFFMGEHGADEPDCPCGFCVKRRAVQKEEKEHDDSHDNRQPQHPPKLPPEEEDEEEEEVAEDMEEEESSSDVAKCCARFRKKKPAPANN